MREIFERNPLPACFCIVEPLPGTLEARGHDPFVAT